MRSTRYIKLANSSIQTMPYFVLLVSSLTFTYVQVKGQNLQPLLPYYAFHLPTPTFATPIKPIPPIYVLGSYCITFLVHSFIYNPINQTSLQIHCISQYLMSSPQLKYQVLEMDTQLPFSLDCCSQEQEMRWYA